MKYIKNAIILVMMLVASVILMIKLGQIVIDDIDEIAKEAERFSDYMDEKYTAFADEVWNRVVVVVNN